jgi:hypothetical protein
MRKQVLGLMNKLNIPVIRVILSLLISQRGCIVN